MKLKRQFWQPFAGGAIWLIVVIWLHPSPFQTEWAVTLLLLSPLVLVPWVMRLAIQPDRNAVSALWLHILASQLQFPAAVILVAAFAVPIGPLSAVLVLPWFITTAIISLIGLMRIWQRGLTPLHELCHDAGLVYLVIGGGWAALSRWGMRPLDFEAVIVLLTAIHFHYAGFVLPILTGLAGRTLGGIAARVAAIGVVIGVPLVAAGITATQLGFGTLLECFAACLTALAGSITAWLHLRLAMQKTWPSLTRSLWAVAAISLAFSMILAALYGCRFYFPAGWLDIPWMRALHGTANALGFGLAGVAAWNLTNRALVHSAS